MPRNHTIILHILHPINPPSPHFSAPKGTVALGRNSIKQFRLHNSRSLASRWSRTGLAAALAASLIASSTACSDALHSLGSNPATAQANAEQLFGSVADRFSQVELAPQYDHARVRLAESALVPSRVYDDTLVWGARMSPDVRVLYISGELSEDGRYRLEPRTVLAPAARPGDTRHTIALERLASNVYRWNTNVDFAVGGVTADGVAALVSNLLAAPQGRTERELRDDLHAAFPRAAAAAGRGFSIDSLHVVPGALGTTSVSVTVGFHPAEMRAAFPKFASYLDKYLGPAKYHLTLADRSGTELMDLVGRDRSATLRYHLHDGKLATLLGPPRVWPDSLVLTTDLSLKVKLFTIGFRHLVTDFVISRAPHERAWTIVAQREPDWDLPLITERLIRTPLRRPFEGAGSMFRVAARDSAGEQTLVTRRARLDVQESAIVRFLGSLASHMAGELDARVEVEEDRFIHEAFAALQADVRAMGPRCCRKEENASEP